VPFYLRLPLYALIAYAAVCLLVWFFQRNLQYFPDRGPVPRPPGDAFRELEDVRIPTSDGAEIAAWYWPGIRPLTLLFFHGNAGHRGHRLGWVQTFHDLGWGVLLIDYRGYAESTGSPTEEGLAADARAARAWLTDRGVERVAYVGESIGCSVAVELALSDPPVALVLQSGTVSVRAVAQHHYPYLPVGLLMRDRYESASKLERIAVPLLAIHGEKDRIIPIEFGRALFDAAASEEKEWWALAGAGHNDVPWRGGREYYERIHQFLERVTR
jgi:fermentation-respiration switch protein FrsA (DUF1100 family)